VGNEGPCKTPAARWLRLRTWPDGGRANRFFASCRTPAERQEPHQIGQHARSPDPAVTSRRAGDARLNASAVHDHDQTALLQSLLPFARADTGVQHLCARCVGLQLALVGGTAVLKTLVLGNDLCAE
jgi:hypothetical protein